jgi:hypothetical protein
MAKRARTPKGTDRPAPAEGKKKNKIHLSLFVDGQDVTLLEEFNTPAEALAAAREFLDEHHPGVSTRTADRPQRSKRGGQSRKSAR